MIVVFAIVTNVLRLITIILHIIGIHLLVTLHRNGSRTPERIFLINLSISEVMFNFFDILTTPLTDLASFSANASSIVTDVQGYIFILSGYGVVPVYFLSMIYLTIDRLLDIILSIKYHLYCDTKKAKLTLKVTWVISTSTALSLAFLHGFTTVDLVSPCLKYVYPTFEIIFIVLAFITYGFLFHKYRKSRIPPVQVVGSQNRAPTVLECFQTSRFHVPVLLIASFLIFVTVADLMYTFGVAVNYSKMSLVNEICRMSIVIGCLSDAIIYIFISPSVKHLLLKKLRWKKQRPRQNRIGLAYIT